MPLTDWIDDVELHGMCIESTLDRVDDEPVFKLKLERKQKLGGRGYWPSVKFDNILNLTDSNNRDNYWTISLITLRKLSWLSIYRVNRYTVN